MGARVIVRATAAMLLLITLIIPSSADAQRMEAARSGFDPRAGSQTQRGDHRNVAGVSDSENLIPERVIDHGLIGAAIGGFVGLTAAFISTHREAVKDHSEDGLTYILDTAAGIVAGFAVGVIVAYVWK